MNLNVVLRHELHDMINHASADQLFTALYSSQSPIRERMIRFLALSYADWLSTQSNIDDDDIKSEWNQALQMPPQTNLMNVGGGGVHDTGYEEPHRMPPKTQHTLKMREKDPFLGFVDIIDPETIVADPNNSNSNNGNGNGNGNGYMNGNGPHEYSNDESAEVEFHTKDNNNNNNNNSNIPVTPGNGNNNIEDNNNGEELNVQKLYDALPANQQQLLKAKLPLLQDTTQIEKRNEILIKKLALCATTFDFTAPNELQMKAIEKKKQMLTEILEYIARYTWYTEEILERCIKTISCNLFRALPRSGKNPEVEEEPFEDPAWSHLQLIYDLTLRLVINTDVDKKTMKKYLEGEFVDNIIELFSSEDPREREYLKTILHRIYGRFMPLRQFIRQSIANCCYRTIYAGRSLVRNENGIAEFLEIFCSIIHGFSIPVKPEHKDFLRNVLVPLHKCRKLEKFHEQLVACCVQFVFKDPAVASVILGGLLKFWPIQSPTKEEMFIAEVVNVINALINHKSGFSWQENKDMCLQVIDTLVRCMKSPHHSVAERALLVWSEDAIEALIDLDKKHIWPKIVGAFLDNRNHWNESLRECNEEAMDVFKVRDPASFNTIRAEYERMGPNPQHRQKQLQTKRWLQMENYARQKKQAFIAIANGNSNSNSNGHNNNHNSIGKVLLINGSNNSDSDSGSGSGNSINGGDAKNSNSNGYLR
jgi:serine/threonine-protein phosphatase 2A regulatory subunit B'